MKERIAFIDKYAASEDALEATAAFAFMEGVVLFSNFAFLKSFNVGGFNLISHITAGIDGSAKDENYHSMASAWLFNQCLKEREQLGLIDSQGKQNLRKKIKRIAEKVYEHEEALCNKIFEKGGIRTITKEEILDFIKDRINIVLSYLNIKPLYEKEDGVVTEWFYSQLNSFKYSDFFSNQQLQYVRSWKKHELKFDMELIK
jgi:ribonucleotide reductase beta subunit family protein with ferritin-like domain